MNKRESATDNPSKDGTSCACTASNTLVPSTSSSQGHSSHNHEDHEGHSSHEISRHISSPSEFIGPGNTREIDQASGTVDIPDRVNQLNQIHGAFGGFEQSATGVDRVGTEVTIHYDNMPAGFVFPDFKNYDMNQRMNKLKTISPEDGNDSTVIKVTLCSTFKSSCFFVKHPQITKLHKHTRNRFVNAERNTNYNGDTFHLQKKHLLVTLHAYIYMLELTSGLAAQNENFLGDVQRDFGTLLPITISIGSYSWPLSQKSNDGPNIRKLERIVNGAEIRELSNCSICLEENVGNVLLEPCNHYYMCSSCWDKIKIYKCPICRAVIDDVTIYI